MAKQRHFLILQSKCDFLIPFATHFFKSPKALNTARVAGCCERVTEALQPCPFFLQQNRTVKTADFLSFELVCKFAPQNRLADYIGVLLEFLLKRLYRAFLAVTNRYSLFSLPVTATGSFFRLFGAGVTLPLLISINSLTFCGTYFA